MIYGVHLESSSNPEAFGQALMRLPDNIRKQAAKYRSEQDTKRAVFSAMLKRVLACEQNGISLHEAEWIKGEYGKPFLKGFPDFHFNVSHSGDWVVCAVSTDGPIGVDIEHVGRAEPEVARMCFSPKEYEEWRRLPEADQDEHFFELWTLKESYTKAIGRGLSIPLAMIEKEGEGSRMYISCHGEIDRSFRLSILPWADSYKIAVCVSSLDTKTIIQTPAMNEILLRFIELKVK